MASLLRNSKFLKCANAPERKFHSTRKAAAINGRVYGLTFFVTQRRSRSTSASSKDPEEYEYIQRSRVPTMHFQASLPRLPIPKLEDSCRKYLSAQRPILTKDEWKETTSRVSQFLANDGQQLQKRLVDEDARNKHTSYISEPWFHMYLKDRKPLPINYNPLLVFDQESKSGYNDQLVKATNLVVSSARFMKSLRAEILEPEVYHLNPKKSDTELFRSFTRLLPSSVSWYGAYLMKAYPLDMSQYPNLFGTTRIPEIGKDRIAHNPAARHVAVLRKGHFYAFDIFNENGNIRPAREIASSLKEILADPRETNQCPIGSFTTCDRDEWAKNRQHLVKLGSNDRVLEKIDSAAFLLILDDDAVNEDIHKMLRKFLHGSSDNRWFDKSYSLIVARDGYAGVNFEHSWGDGVAILRYFRDIKNDIATKPRFDPEEVSDLPATAAVEKLDIVVDAEVKQKVDLAVKQYSKWIDRLSVDYLLYDGFGKKECKQFGVSPDAVMQVAFQLALYKLEGRAVATYESCSTSAFKHGRTETIRSCTIETQALCSAIVKQGKSGVSNSDLKKLMLDCSKAHGNLVKEGAMGQGFDRHLFALKNVWEKSNQSGSMPAIFTDPAYAKLNHNILSTSTLSSPEVKAGGFGPVVQDGYGIGYMILDHILGSVVTSYKEHRDAAVYVESLTSAVKDIHGIMKST